MKKFLFKLLFLTQSVIALFFLRTKIHQAWEGFHYDTFNVFHWKKIRFTDAEPNKNFIKTKYILANPQKFNAFVFGSSRVQYLPPDMFPKKDGEKDLRWYNMTTSSGIPAANYLTLKTFLDKHIDIDMVILAFDDIAMCASIEIYTEDLMRVPYQQIMKDKLRYLQAYLFMETDKSIIEQVNSYDSKAHEQDSEIFYEWGGSLFNPALAENPDMTRYETLPFTHIDSFELKASAVYDIKTICNLCAEHKIKLILITNPLWHKNYKSAVESKYLDFLRSIAKKCEFYNFSSLNNYTKDPQFYFESSHYRTALGLLVEKMLFGTEEEKAQIRKDAGDELWGIKVNAENVDFVIQNLRGQLEKSE